jgi:ribosomal protein S11
MKLVFGKKIKSQNKIGNQFAKFTKRGGGKKRGQKMAIVHIKCTKNNTIYTLTDLSGNTRGWVSGGSVGYRHSRKTSFSASEKSSREILTLTKKCGYESLLVKVKGYSRRKKGLLRPLLSKGSTKKKVSRMKKSKKKIFFEKVINSSSVPFNGCRPPLRRRK